MRGRDSPGQQPIDQLTKSDAATGTEPMSYEERELQDRIKPVKAVNSDSIPAYDGPVPDEPDSGPKPPTASDENPSDDQEDFEPCLLFFYGSLMDPHVLKTVAALNDMPKLEDAWIEDFGMKMWHGMYPVLLAGEIGGMRIQGKAWRATTMAQCLRLQRYETSAYEPTDCLIHLGDGEPVKGLVFAWAGKSTSSELVEGKFDLEHWQKTHKATLF